MTKDKESERDFFRFSSFSFWSNSTNMYIEHFLIESIRNRKKERRKRNIYIYIYIERERNMPRKRKK